MTMSALERRITIAAVIVPFIGFLAAIVLLWGGLVSGLDLLILALMYLPTGFGITIGYHRMLTHRSFDAPVPVRALLAIFGSMSLQGAPIHWVADHRKHHAFTDEDGDPHSPHLHETTGVRGVVEGWWHSHTGWLFDRKDRASARKFARDLRDDPVIRWVDRHFIAWVLLGLAIPFALGFLLSGGSLWAGFTAFLWGGLVRIFLQHHATWSVNSICHMYGTRRFVTEDESRNNWIVALVSLGEGWHHNHHAFPRSAVHGLRRRELDPSAAIISVMEKLGLARDVVRIPAERQLERESVGPAARQKVAA
jgi:stearoyl-CoA desaturase (delta-9 desaturase)